MKQPILSICIPTKNRGSNLQVSLEKITNDAIFKNTDKVQVVISDNCSDDNTQDICLSFQKKYPDKIVYKRQDRDLHDKNFIEVLNLGKGRYLKLNNDNIYFSEGELENFIKFLEKDVHSEIIFLSNANHKSDGIHECKNLNELISTISYFITWIGGFCINNELYHSLSNPEKCSHLQLAQVDIICRLVSYGNSVTIYGKKSAISASFVKNRGYYSMAKVFGVNYLSIINEYYSAGEITKEVYECHKKELLKHINFYTFNISSLYDKENYFEYLIPIYGKNLYFYVEYIKCHIRNFFQLIFNIKNVDDMYKNFHILFFNIKIKRKKRNKNNV